MTQFKTRNFTFFAPRTVIFYKKRGLRVFFLNHEAKVAVAQHLSNTKTQRDAYVLQRQPGKMTMLAA